jgi:hypothetical protein
MNRYYNSGLGRFLTPDPYRASGGPAAPGSWNRYGYVQGDPVNFNDNAGLLRNIVGNCGALVDGQPQDGCNGGAGDNELGSNSTCFADALGLSFEPNPLCSSYEPAAAAAAARKAKRRTYYLVVTLDCYNVPKEGAVTRDITYKMMYLESDMPIGIPYHLNNAQAHFNPGHVW